MAIDCPHCRKSLGGPSTEGGTRVRVGITVIDPDGTVHGPCPHCKQDVIVADGAVLSKALQPQEPSIGVPRRRRLVVGLAIDRTK